MSSRIALPPRHQELHELRLGDERREHHHKAGRRSGDSPCCGARVRMDRGSSFGICKACGEEVEVSA